MKVELSRQFYKHDYPTAMREAREMSSTFGTMDWPKYRDIMRRYESARLRRVSRHRQTTVAPVQFGETLPLPFPEYDT